MNDEAAVLVAEQTVRVSLDRARHWFLALEDHPERYRFETHAGFTFLKGDFAEVGAKFRTQEWFHAIPLTLDFELTEVGKMYFRFRLTRPPLPIWGAFALEPVEHSQDLIRLCLVVGGESCLGCWLLRFPLFQDAIQDQIEEEVNHIAASMERIEE